MSVRSSQILYRINSAVDQKLGPKRNTCHSNGTSCCRNCSAGGKIAGCTAALCTVAVCGQCKVSKICSLTGRTGIGRIRRGIFRLLGSCLIIGNLLRNLLLGAVLGNIFGTSGLYIIRFLFLLYNNVCTCRAAGRLGCILLRIIAVIIVRISLFTVLVILIGFFLGCRFCCLSLSLCCRFSLSFLFCSLLRLCLLYQSGNTAVCITDICHQLLSLFLAGADLVYIRVNIIACAGSHGLHFLLLGCTLRHQIIDLCGLRLNLFLILLDILLKTHIFIQHVSVVCRNLDRILRAIEEFCKALGRKQCLQCGSPGILIHICDSKLHRFILICRCLLRFFQFFFYFI